MIAKRSPNQTAVFPSPYDRCIHQTKPKFVPAPKVSSVKAAPTEFPCWNIEPSCDMAIIGVA